MTGLKWSGFLAQHESELWSSELRSIRAPIVCLACFPSLLPRLSRKLLWSPIFFGRTTLKMALGRWFPLRSPRKAVAFTNWKFGTKEAREWDKNGRISKRNFRNEKVASETGKGYEALFWELYRVRWRGTAQTCQKLSSPSPFLVNRMEFFSRHPALRALFQKFLFSEPKKVK